MAIPLSVSHIVATALNLIGIIVSFIAIATPAWQVVYAYEIQQWIQSGLWLNCQTRPNGMYACAYIFTGADLDFYRSPELNNLRSPPFYPWQRTLLWLFLGAQFMAFLALISIPLSVQESTRKIGGGAFLALIASSVLLHCIGIIAFIFLSQMIEYRFYHVSVSGIYEKHRGYSFFVELAGTTILVASLIASVMNFINLMSSRQKYASRNPLSDQDLYTNDESWEMKFAMRELPPVPDQRQYKYGEYNYY